MRNELYADSRDELKWTVATTNATTRNQSIRWVAMFRQDIGFHGNGVQNVPNAATVVTEFFLRERQAFQGTETPALERVVVLCQALQLPISMNLGQYPVSVKRRLAYIQNEIRYLEGRPQTQRDFVLVDPDNGIGRQSKTGMQFHEAHVPLVWNGLRQGDTFGVVQFQHREDDWINRRRQRLAELIGVQVEQVESFAWNNVCVLTVHR
jgi:hypothetical protein